jgi:phosphoribosylformylglycinamidine synthase
VFKVETHNSPSALDPYGGALTGIVGVNRDPLGTGQGARLIFNTDVFCFASPFRIEPVPRGLLHPRRILEGVREGVEHGGNKSGIPTVNGSVVFDERFLGKPLVFCGTAGLLPARLHGRPGHEKRARPGDRIVMAGGRIGKDGIHGATFSSEELHQHSPVSAVQIGDPITQKRLADFILRARDEGLYHSLTDDGAGGLSSSVGEMAREAGGCRLELTAAPLKYPGLASWEILLSEAQERMTLSVPPEKLPRLLELARRYQVEATDLGCFEESGRFEVIDHGRTVALLPMDFLHDGLPRLELVARFDPPRESAWRAPARPAGELLHQMLSRLNICSKAYWVRQYDHEVQAGTVLKPLLGARDDGPSDAAVFRPLLDSFEAVAVSHGICPRLSDFDAGVMAECAVDEGVRNAVAVGADPDRMAGLDNFCWCDPIQSESNPDGDRKAGQLVRAGRGLRRVCLAYGIPLISGKDSMKNDAVIEGRRISIPPTLLFSVLGLMPDARRAVSMDAKAPDHALFVLGATRDELLGSELQAHLGASGGFLPRVRAEAQIALYRALYRAIQDGCLASCHDCSDGGLAVALAESAFAGDLGMEVDLARVPREGEMGETELLYAETPGRFVVTVPPDRVERFLTHMRGQSAQRVGTVTAAPRLVLRGGSGGVLLDEPIEALRRSWLRPLDF